MCLKKKKGIKNKLACVLTGSLKRTSVQRLRYRLGVGSRIGCHRIIVSCYYRDADAKQETLICLQCSVKMILVPNEWCNFNRFIWRTPVKLQQLLSAPLCCIIIRTKLEVTFNQWLTFFRRVWCEIQCMLINKLASCGQGTEITAISMAHFTLWKADTNCIWNHTHMP